MITGIAQGPVRHPVITLCGVGNMLQGDVTDAFCTPELLDGQIVSARIVSGHHSALIPEAWLDLAILGIALATNTRGIFGGIKRRMYPLAAINRPKTISVMPLISEGTQRLQLLLV